MHTAKEQVRQLLDTLPDNATLSDIRYTLSDSLYTFYVSEQIELGMRDSRAGQVIAHSDVKKRYLNGGR